MMRLRIEWRVAAPYPRAADLSVGARFAFVRSEHEATWTLEDDHGETHTIDRRSLESHAASDASPRWVVTRPIPTLGLGDEVLMRWSTRSAPATSPQSEDRKGRVVAEDVDKGTIEDDRGERHRHWRANGHEVIESAADRNRLRLVIVNSSDR